MAEQPYREKVLKRIENYELEGKFDVDPDDNPPTLELMPNEIDYLNKTLSKKFKTWIVNKVGQKFINKLIKENKLILDKVSGIENFKAIDGGAIITCNHFHPFDNFAVWEAIRPFMKHKRLYKVIREGNYTNPPAGFGEFFKYGNTLPLSQNSETMKKFLRAINILLSRGEKILVYPEQGMWWNYRKPRPLKNGAFNFAVKNNVPVLPIFITMKDSDFLDDEGYPVQKLTVNILPAIYPSDTLNKTENIEKMKEENYQKWVEVYEKIYNLPLKYKTKEEKK